MFIPTLIVLILLLGFIAHGFIQGVLEYLKLNKPYYRPGRGIKLSDLNTSIVYDSLIHKTKSIEQAFDEYRYIDMLFLICDGWTNCLHYIGLLFIPKYVETKTFWGFVFILSPISGSLAGWRWLTLGCVQKHFPSNPTLNTHNCNYWPFN